jgi:hypothetical protein
MPDPLRIALVTSASIPGADHLLADPSRGTAFELVAVVADEPPTRELAQRLHRLGADYVILVGYPHILAAPLLEVFGHRVIALHDGDLTRVDDTRRRKYTGSDPVKEALLAGEQETRVSAFLLNGRADGPLVLLSGAYPFSSLVEDARCWGDADLLMSYAPVHRSWMRRDAYGVMLQRIAQLLAAGTFQVVDDIVWIDGVPGPCRMGEAPHMCREREIVRGIPSSCPFITR